MAYNPSSNAYPDMFETLHAYKPAYPQVRQRSHTYTPIAADNSPAKVLPTPDVIQFLDSKIDTNTFTAGKYRGQPFQHVLETDPSYIRYLVLNPTKFASLREDIEHLIVFLNQRMEKKQETLEM
jgi:hypothetical protein